VIQYTVMGTPGGSIVQNDGQLERVRLVEPHPGIPANQLPGLDQLLARTRRGKFVYTAVVFGIITGIGVASAPYAGPGLASMLTFGPALMASVSIRVLVATAGMAEAATRPFTLVDVAPDGMRVAGRAVGLQLPDHRWLTLRTGEPNRLLIAGIRRVWLLGPDARGRAFVLVPGNVRLHTARLRDAPPSDSEPVPPAQRTPLRPNEDPILVGHLRATSRRLLVIVGVFLLIAATSLWAGFDTAIRSHLRAAGEMTAGFVLAFAMLLIAGQILVAWFKQRKLLPADAGWFELRVSLSAPFSTTGAGITVLTGYATLPDNSVHSFRTAKIDAALAANIAVTGQLWAIGPFRRGKPIAIGLPGYPLFGQVTLDVR